MDALDPLVCVSHNAPPMNDAEALCTVRLLSALAELGANVHLSGGRCSGIARRLDHKGTV